MVLVERSKVRIRRIKGKFEGKEKGLLILEILGETKKRKGTRREKKERRKREKKP